MADYYPLIARAVAGLDTNTGETRRTLYERARAALVAQLRSVEPALEESEITRERLSLEEAIRKVEAEAVRRSRDEPAPADRPSLSDDALRGFRDTVGGIDDSVAATGGAGTHETGHYPPEPSEPPADDRDDTFAPPYEDEQPPAEYEPRSDAYRRSLEPEVPELDRVHAPTGPAPLDDLADELDRPRRSYGGLIRLLVVLLIIGGIAGAAYWQREQLTMWWTALRSMTEPAPASREATAAKPKIADRIAPGGAPSQPAARPATPSATEAAQKVVLYEEIPGDPKGKRAVGSALWRTETVSPGSGLAPELAVRADVEIPERRMRMTLSMRRNTDNALPASHTIEIMFTLPADFPEGSISNVPGVLMKNDEQGRGAPLAGLAVKVTSGFFLIGLSAVEVDVQRNLQMLKERAWMDIPIVYSNGQRAILAIEKGAPGEKAFADAFAAWTK